MVGFLGEYHALPDLSQKGGVPEKVPVCENGYGHSALDAYELMTGTSVTITPTIGYSDCFQNSAADGSGPNIIVRCRIEMMVQRGFCRLYEKVRTE